MISQVGWAGIITVPQGGFEPDGLTLLYAQVAGGPFC